MPPRDMQRSKLYKAERATPAWGKDNLGTVDAVEIFLAKLIKSKWWIERFPQKTQVKVRDGRGCRIARGFNGGPDKMVLTLPKWARTKIVVLHELAHAITSTKVAWHGPEFAGTFLELVSQVLGKAAGEDLRGAYVAHGVAHGYEIPVILPELVIPRGNDSSIKVSGFKGVDEVVVRFIDLGRIHKRRLTREVATGLAEALLAMVERTK